MEEIIAALIQILVEMLGVFLEACFEGAFSWLFEATFEWLADIFFKRAGEKSLRFFFFTIGALAGTMSAEFATHASLHHGWQRLGVLVLAPLFAGVISWSLAKFLHRLPYKDGPRNHFWRSFWLALGFVLIRFAYAQRG